MPVYFVSDREVELSLLVEAKSEREARLYMTRHMQCEIVGAKRMAELVLEGVKVERAPTSKEAEANEAATRG